MKLRYLLRVLRRWVLRLMLVGLCVVLIWGLAYRWINPPGTFYILAQRWHLGSIKRKWVDIEDVAPVMVRALVAAEDANFCNHWGVDSTALQQALRDGAHRGGSTITQQVVKNLFLWHGRSWLRKAIEAIVTPYVEIIWSKKRILEFHLNFAEYDTGVFGIQAAARHHFGIDARDLNRMQAARLAVVLPDPKGRSAISPSPALRKRVKAVIAGSDLIGRDDRARCFEP